MTKILYFHSQIFLIVQGNSPIVIIDLLSQTAMQYMPVALKVQCHVGSSSRDTCPHMLRIHGVVTRLKVLRTELKNGYLHS